MRMRTSGGAWHWTCGAWTPRHRRQCEPSQRAGPVIARAQTGTGAAAAVPALAKALAGGDPVLSGLAATALGRIGKAAVPALTTPLQDGSVDARCRAAEALTQLGPAAAAAVPGLEKALHDANQAVSGRA